MNQSMYILNVFDSLNHLKPTFDKTEFDSLHSWDFGWALLEPINIAQSQEDEIELSKRLSPGQKALYFFWYLDAQVVNGGFIQFYWNDYREYLPTIKEGLKLIDDVDLINLIEKADKEYLENESLFIKQKEKGDWEPLYENLKRFDEYDDLYYAIHEKTMGLIEAYARRHPEDFVELIYFPFTFTQSQL